MTDPRGHGPTHRPEDITSGTMDSMQERPRGHGKTSEQTPQAALADQRFIVNYVRQWWGDSFGHSLAAAGNDDVVREDYAQIAADLAAAGYVIVNRDALAAALEKQGHIYAAVDADAILAILAAIAAPAAEPDDSHAWGFAARPPAEPTNEWVYQRTRNGGAPYEPDAAEPDSGPPMTEGHAPDCDCSLCAEPEGEGA